MQAQPDRLVFIYESEPLKAQLVQAQRRTVKTNMTKTRGRAPKGQRLNAAAPFGRWSTQTFIAVQTADALIALWIVPGAMNGEAFATYVETQRAPVLEPGTVVILDNLSTHRNARAAQTLRARGCWFLYQPPYSPDPCVTKISPLD